MHDDDASCRVQQEEKTATRGRTVRFSRHTNGAVGGGMVAGRRRCRQQPTGPTPPPLDRTASALLLLEMESTQVRRPPSLSRASAVPVRVSLFCPGR